MKQAILNLALLTFVFLSSCKKTETLPIEDPFISKVQNYIKSQLSEAELSQLDWSKLITYDRTGKHEIVKIPLVGNIKGTDKSIYLKVVKDSFVGNYFQLRGNDVKAEIVTTSLDSKTVGVAVISNNIYDGNYKVYENGSLIKETNISLPTSVSRSVPASYVYNYQLHYLINL